MRIKKYLAHGPGHMVLQATRPQTLAYALTDSPVGQMAWIAKKFTEWTDPQFAGDVRAFFRDLRWPKGPAATRG